MRFFQTIKNIWTIEELRQRILVTLLLVLEIGRAHVRTPVTH